MYVAYHVDDDDTGTPVAVAPTREEAQNRAIVRVLGMGCSVGHISVQDRSDLTDAETEELTGVLDAWFAEKGLP